MKKIRFETDIDGFHGVYWKNPIKADAGLILMLGDDAEDYMAKSGVKWAQKQGFKVDNGNHRICCSVSNCFCNNDVIVEIGRFLFIELGGGVLGRCLSLFFCIPTPQNQRFMVGKLRQIGAGQRRERA